MKQRAQHLLWFPGETPPTAPGGTTGLLRKAYKGKGANTPAYSVCVQKREPQCGSLSSDPT